jgi:poly-gamma-glutamate synthesis protein (capsule biosynthesis protein)
VAGCRGGPPAEERTTPTVTGSSATATRDSPTPTTEPGCLDGSAGDAVVGFVGDVMLGRSVNDHWTGEEPAGVWGTTLDRLQALDGLVLNLECCVAAEGKRWPGKTYYFRAHPDFAVPALEAAGTSVASLANNHVLDFRAPALRATRDHLDSAGIAHAGAGPDRATAFEPAITDVAGTTVAVVALTDRLPSYAAGLDSPGTAYAPLDRSVPAIRELVVSALDSARDHDPDLVVASLHWGPNWETAPDATQRAFARWLIDRGVDVVHGHSAHVLQGVEVYRGRPIVYDAGDFVDDYIHKDGLRNKHSALFEVVLADGGLDELRLVPVEIVDETATLADREAAAWVRSAMRERSAALDTTVERAGAGLSVPLGDC